MDEKESILIVDDDESTCKSLRLIFRKKGYETETSMTGQEAIEKARGRFFNVALLDIRLPDMEGIDLLVPLKEMHPDMVAIMVTGYASLETAVRALKGGASAYITKPLNMDEVLATVSQALEKQRLVFENRRLYQEAQRELAERKRMEQQLLWSQKMEAVGRLAGGVAHDFNNTLTTIRCCAELGMMKLRPGERPHEDFQEILRASDRAANLIRQLLAFPRRQIIEPKVINLNNVLLDMDKMFRRLMGEDIELVTLSCRNRCDFLAVSWSQ